MKKNILKKIKIIFFMIVMSLLIFSTKVDAARISISTSKSSVSPGETFTVTVSVSGGAGQVTTTVSNGSGSKSDFLDNNSYSFSCKAGNSGTVKIAASGELGDYATEKDENRSASKSVSIIVPNTEPKPSSNSNSSSGNGNTSSSGNSTTQKPATQKPTTTVVKKSSDANLSGITIEGFKLGQEFSSATTEYTVSVPNEIDNINVTATVSDSKATYSVSGDKGLKVGENIVTITGKAEDGTTKTYTIKVTRDREKLALKELSFQYKTQEGELVDLILNPVFVSNVYEYSLNDVPYYVENLILNSVANLEGATIQIQGNESIKEGENTITIVLEIPKETKKVESDENIENQTDEILEYETVSYTIKFNREAEPIPPTTMQKIQNWFNGIGGTISTWYLNNQKNVIMGSLMFCIVVLFGLSIYIVIDYKKYKKLLLKFEELKNLNKAESATIENKIVDSSIEQDINSKGKKIKSKKPVGRHF